MADRDRPFNVLGQRGGNEMDALPVTSGQVDSALPFIEQQSARQSRVELDDVGGGTLGIFLDAKGNGFAKFGMQSCDFPQVRHRVMLEMEAP